MISIQIVEVPEKKRRGRKPILTDEERQQRKIDRNERSKELYRTIYMAKRDTTVRVLCKCGEYVREANASRHRRSAKCIDRCRQNEQLDNEDK